MASTACASAVRTALARMNSDSVTPRDLADWAIMSRSCGRRRTATRAVRCRDSERDRDGTSRRALSCFMAVCLPGSAGLPRTASDHARAQGGIIASAPPGPRGPVGEHLRRGQLQARHLRLSQPGMGSLMVDPVDPFPDHLLQLIREEVGAALGIGAAAVDVRAFVAGQRCQQAFGKGPEESAGDRTSRSSRGRPRWSPRPPRPALPSRPRRPPGLAGPHRAAGRRWCAAAIPAAAPRTAPARRLLTWSIPGDSRSPVMHLE